LKEILFLKKIHYFVVKEFVNHLERVGLCDELTVIPGYHYCISR